VVPLAGEAPSDPDNRLRSLPPACHPLRTPHPTPYTLHPTPHSMLTKHAVPPHTLNRKPYPPHSAPDPIEDGSEDGSK
jgi:hypothetical protein